MQIVLRCLIATAVIALQTSFAKTAEPAVPILVYHRLGAVRADSMTVTTEHFRKQINLLSNNNYSVIPLATFVDWRLKKGPAPPPRDGDWKELPRHEVVPGDIVRVFAGDLVPGDARLIQSKDLYVQQAALTGESLPVEKEIAADRSATDKPEAAYMIFLGTSVVSGSAVAEVTATGPRTLFGGIAARLAVRPEENEFERGLRQFGLLITRVVFFLVLFLITVSIALHRDPLESLLFAVALAVGLTPEFLPMITSVTLARGAVQMARQKVIVKRLPANRRAYREMACQQIQPFLEAHVNSPLETCVVERVFLTSVARDASIAN